MYKYIYFSVSPNSNGGRPWSHGMYALVDLFNVAAPQKQTILTNGQTDGRTDKLILVELGNLNLEEPDKVTQSNQD
jgi:hypothetical protein